MADDTKQPAWVGQILPRLPTLVALIHRYAGGLPGDFLLGWISFESGGNIASHTDLDERGYFQLIPAESSDLGLTPDQHAQLSTDPDFSMQTGIRLVNKYVARTQSLGFSPSSDSFWHWVKLNHSIGSGAVAKIIADLRSNGIEPTTSSWDDVESFIDDNEARLFALLNHSPTKWFDSVDTVISRARMLGAITGLSSPLVALPFALAIGGLIYLLLKKGRS